MADLIYGESYRIQNNYSGWRGGYLDVRGAGCHGNLYCVSASRSFNRGNYSGTWQILSATGKAVGETVLANDQFHLLNQFDKNNNRNGGYLDIRGDGIGSGSYSVSTSASDDRDSGSGTWRIFTDSSDSNVQEDEVIHLLNGYKDFTGGFLDTRGTGCEGNMYCVLTSATWNREKGSTQWRFHRQ